jgi:hypothetical protein
MSEQKTNEPHAQERALREIVEPYDLIAHALARAEVRRLSGSSADRRLRRLQAAADAGFDTWEEYRGER